MFRWFTRLFVFLALATSGLAAGQRADLSGVTSWAYWLQDTDIDELIASPYDVVVIDYSSNGKKSGAYSRRDIRRLQAAGKIVLAYLSIGEAEDYRFYWRSDWRPGWAFIGGENPDWPGNYKVKYWRKGWWNLALRPYLNRILRAEFDGVYLDIIDAYYFWGEGKNGRTYGLARSATRMCALVQKIAGYTRSRAGKQFIVCPQNGFSVLEDATARWRKRFLRTIDAGAMEDVFYNYESLVDQGERLGYAQTLATEGNLVLNVEYIAAGSHAEYTGFLAAQAFTMVGYPAVEDRELDELVPP